MYFEILFRLILFKVFSVFFIVRVLKYFGYFVLKCWGMFVYSILLLFINLVEFELYSIGLNFLKNFLGFIRVFLFSGE